MRSLYILLPFSAYLSSFRISLQQRQRNPQIRMLRLKSMCGNVRSSGWTVGDILFKKNVNQMLDDSQNGHLFKGNSQGERFGVRRKVSQHFIL